MRNKITFFILIALMVVSCSKSVDRDKMSWDKALSPKSIASLREYIAEFPNGKYRAAADSSIQVLVWEETKKINTPEIYEKYILENPNGFYINEAKKNFEEMLWVNAENTSNMEYYVKYKSTFPNGKYIIKAKNHIEKYLIESERVGVFKIGMNLERKKYSGFEIKYETKEVHNPYEGENIEITSIFAYENNQKALKFITGENDDILSIKVLSDKFRTNTNISIDSNINDFVTLHPDYLVDSQIIDAEVGEREYIFMRIKNENGVEFEIQTTSEHSFSIERKKIINPSPDIKLDGIWVFREEVDKYDELLIAQRQEIEREEEEKKRLAERARQQQNNTSNKSRTINNPSSSSNSYNRTNRDVFVNRSSVLEFLANHTFRSSDGTKITYDMSTLSITFSNNKTLLFINVELLGFNENTARIRALCTSVSNYTTTLTLSASNGTITDSDGVTYKTN